jgi:hypothetical protein
MHTVTVLTALVSVASAAKLGFNYGSTFTSGAAKMQSDFEAEFTTAANLKGTKGWTSARLYTMVVSHCARFVMFAFLDSDQFVPSSKVVLLVTPSPPSLLPSRPRPRFCWVSGRLAVIRPSPTNSSH